jgi:prefoldin subunit 5
MNAEVVSRLEESFGLKPPPSGLHPLEAVFQAYQRRQSISSLQAEIASLSTHKASLQNILGNTQLVANLVKTDEALHTSALEIKNLNELIRRLNDDIAIRTGAMVSMEAELYDLEKATPELFDKLKKTTGH